MLDKHKNESLVNSVKEWVVDLEAMLISPEVVRGSDVKIAYTTLKKYTSIEKDVSKKDVILNAIRKQEGKVIYGITDSLKGLSTTQYGLISSDLSKFANTEFNVPVITPADKLKVGYKGVKYIDIASEEVQPYLHDGLFNGNSGQFVHDFGLIENQYVILGNKFTNSHTKFYIVRNEQLDEINYNSGVIKGVGGDKITHRNDRQRLAMDLLNRRDIPLKLLTGIYGAGKDFLMLNKAVELIANPHEDFNKLVFIRNNSIVEDVNDIGFLPNGLNEKLKPFMMPIVDICGGMDGFLQVFGALDDKYDKNEIEDEESDMQMNSFELVYLGHIKGRSWDNAIIYVTEAEDLTPKHAQIILSRAGEGTEVWFNGDEAQADSSKLKANNGIQALKDLKGNEMFGTVELDKTERSKLARLSGLL